MRFLVALLTAWMGIASSPPSPDAKQKPDRRPSGVPPLYMELISSAEASSRPNTMSGTRHSTSSFVQLLRRPNFQRSQSLNSPANLKEAPTFKTKVIAREANGAAGDDRNYLPPIELSLSAFSPSGSSAAVSGGHGSTDSFDPENPDDLFDMPHGYLRHPSMYSPRDESVREEEVHGASYMEARSQSPFLFFSQQLRKHGESGSRDLSSIASSMTSSDKVHVLWKSLEKLQSIGSASPDSEATRSCATFFTDTLFTGGSREGGTQLVMREDNLLTEAERTCGCLTTLETVLYDAKLTLGEVRFSPIPVDYPQPEIGRSSAAASSRQQFQREVAVTPTTDTFSGIRFKVSVGLLYSQTASQLYWYIFQEEVRVKLLELVRNTERPPAIYTDNWWGFEVDRHNLSFIPLSMMQMIVGLLEMGDSKSAEVARDMTFYSKVYYRTGGKDWHKRLSLLDRKILTHVLYIEYTFAGQLKFNVEQYKVALHISKLVSSPALVLSTMMPEQDVAPKLSSILDVDKATKITRILWGDIIPVVVSSRLLLGIVDGEAQKSSDCLIMQIAIKTTLPGESDDPQSLIHDMSPDIYSPNSYCISSYKEADMVALPMMAYHFITMDVIRIKFIHMGFLFEIMVKNMNLRVVDRAARLRAATSVIPPRWWTEFRRSPIVLVSLFPGMEVSSSEFRDIISKPFSVGHVAKFRSLEASGYLEKEEARTPQSRLIINVLRWLVQSIEHDGDWLTPQSWIWVTNLYGIEFNEALPKPAAEKAPVKERITQVSSVAAILSHSTRGSHAINVAEDLEKVMPAGGPYAPERLAECQTASDPVESVKLASKILERMAAAL